MPSVEILPWRNRAPTTVQLQDRRPSEVRAPRSETFTPYNLLYACHTLSNTVLNALTAPARRSGLGSHDPGPGLPYNGPPTTQLELYCTHCTEYSTVCPVAVCIAIGHRASVSIGISGTEQLMHLPRFRPAFIVMRRARSVPVIPCCAP